MSFICMRTQIVPAFIALSFIGWIVFVAGFGKQNEEYVAITMSLIVYKVYICSPAKFLYINYVPSNTVISLLALENRMKSTYYNYYDVYKVSLYEVFVYSPNT